RSDGIRQDLLYGCFDLYFLHHLIFNHKKRPAVIGKPVILYCSLTMAVTTHGIPMQICATTNC
ncbi:MAG: hypothetical protein V3V53_17580, partial [Bacteroidales bacterium]